ncbi:DUF1194 domain-containing protein [Mesorhizobium sp. WSM3868]|uniref:DUF1194 domain-containing protein n=1 Tax=Mesorhizobium sp. WSM3868 TaxID=2029405 RepID=UPI000BAFEDFE|nr:DUF1194 domain-containing protein [Mesorhizobium sp. WSM3868]PBB30259.1 hypothetical protein CK221_29115 [Mesorhizobium sp. WSM3868]
MAQCLHEELNSRSNATFARARDSLPTPTRRLAAGPGLRSSPWLRLALLSAAAFCSPAAHAADADIAVANVDVAIVFAVDFSSSIAPMAADMQREGHAAALTSPEIISAISENYLGCIGVTYFEWSSAGHSRTVLPWTRICGLEDAKVAAAVIRRKGDTGYIRRGRGGTSVSAAIDVGSLLLDRFPGNAMRKVIDISSNGENNDGLPVQPSRQNAIAKGYTINAIAISPLDEDPKHPLATYFARSVIGGSRAFVISPNRPRDYTAALRRKLVIEVSMNALSRL